MGLPVYNKINWDEQTPITATNLDTMDEGIKNNNDYLQEIGGNRFQVSGNIMTDGFTSTFSVGGDRGALAQVINIEIPSGKQLILRRARYNLIGADFRISIDDSITGPFDNLEWTSANTADDVTPNYTFPFSGTTTLAILLYNTADTSRDVEQGCGWCLDFEIVEV